MEQPAAPPTHLNIVIDPELHRRVKITALLHQQTMRAAVLQAIEAWLERTETAELHDP